MNADGGVGSRIPFAQGKLENLANQRQFQIDPPIGKSVLFPLGAECANVGFLYQIKGTAELLTSGSLYNETVEQLKKPRCNCPRPSMSSRSRLIRSTINRLAPKQESGSSDAPGGVGNRRVSYTHPAIAGLVPTATTMGIA